MVDCQKILTRWLYSEEHPGKMDATKWDKLLSDTAAFWSTMTGFRISILEFLDRHNFELSAHGVHFYTKRPDPPYEQSRYLVYLGPGRTEPWSEEWARVVCELLVYEGVLRAREYKWVNRSGQSCANRRYRLATHTISDNGQLADLEAVY